MSLPYPQVLGERTVLDAQVNVLDRLEDQLRGLATASDRQAGVVQGAWRSPTTDAEVDELRRGSEELRGAAGQLVNLRPSLVAARNELEAGAATYRRLRSQADGLSRIADPAIAEEERRRIDQQYRSLVAQLDGIERRTSSAAASTELSLGRILAAVSGMLHGTHMGALLIGAPMSGPIKRFAFGKLAVLESNLPGSGHRAWFGAKGNGLLDRVRAPRLPASSRPGPVAPVTGLLRRTSMYLRAPLVQTVFHQNIRRAQERLATNPKMLERLGTLGRYGKYGARASGAVGAVMTVVSVPGNYRAAHEQHLADGYSAAEATIRAREDVAFRTTGEVLGAAGGAKAGAAIGAVAGSFILGPGVGTVVGGVVGGAIGAVAGSQVGGWLGDQAKKGFRAARETVGAVTSKVGDAASSVASATSSVVSGAASTATDAASNVAGKASSAASSAKSGVGNALGSIKKKIF
jgi:hypothetical protein